MDKLQQAELEEVKTTERFTIDTPDKANWALRKIRALQTQIKETDGIADREIERIEHWRKTENDKFKNQVTRFESMLTEYHMSILEQDPDKKTISLPAGEIKARQQQPKFTRDETTLTEWAKTNNPYYLTHITKLQWGELKKNIQVVGDKAYDKETGEIIPGIEVEEQGIKFSVKVDE